MGKRWSRSNADRPEPSTEWDSKMPRTVDDVLQLLERRIVVHEAWADAIERGDADDAVAAGVGTVESHRRYAKQYRDAQLVIYGCLLPRDEPRSPKTVNEKWEEG